MSLIFACRDDTPEHRGCPEWLHAVENGLAAFGMSDLVQSDLARIVRKPSPLEDPTEFARQISESCRIASPSFLVPATGQYSSAFAGIPKPKGNLVPDALLAALAIEPGAEWLTLDGDLARFPGIRWRRPLDLG